MKVTEIPHVIFERKLKQQIDKKLKAPDRYQTTEMKSISTAMIDLQISKAKFKFEKQTCNNQIISIKTAFHS